ncbi:hypothetical protein ACHAXR_004225 [Thalassiosira sp. AJA248-18]
MYSIIPVAVRSAATAARATTASEAQDVSETPSSAAAAAAPSFGASSFRLMPTKRTPREQPTFVGSAKLVTLPHENDFTPTKPDALIGTNKTPETPKSGLAKHSTTPRRLFFSPMKNQTEIHELSSKKRKRGDSPEILEGYDGGRRDNSYHGEARSNLESLAAKTGTKTENGTWRIKIGGELAGHGYWMCPDCSSGVPSLAKPCEKCKRGGTSFGPLLDMENFAEEFAAAGNQSEDIAAKTLEKFAEEIAGNQSETIVGKTPEWQKQDWQQQEQTEEHHHATAATLEPMNQRVVMAAAKKEGKLFVLYDETDDKHINHLHNIVRRDIWEGFVVGADDESPPENDNRRTFGRLTRYDGTIGFRCRYCKNAPASERAEKSAVYPRSLERIYLANIRFQRDHVEHCTFIPKKVKDDYTRLKNCKGTRGKKKYWVTSAEKRGLCNGENGIVFSPESK